MLFCQGCEAAIEISVLDGGDLEAALNEFTQVFGVDHTADFKDLFGIKDDDVGPNQVKSAHKSLAKLFETAGDTCSKDFPLCPECSEKTIQSERRTLIVSAFLTFLDFLKFFTIY
jgi:hypothetical protein